MDITLEPVEVPQAPRTAVEEISERDCEICNQPVQSDERWEILRATGPAWRHNWHTEPV